MSRVLTIIAIISAAAGSRMRHDRLRGRSSEGRVVAPVAISRNRGRRTADRPLHPRHRQPDRRGPGRRRGRNAGSRRRHAGRARHAGRGGHRADSAVLDGNRRAAQGSRGQRRADRGAARPHAHGDLRRERRAGGAEREGGVRAGATASSRASSRCSTSASCRSRNSISGRRSSKQRASSCEAAKNAAAQQYQSLLAARARVTLAAKALADTSVRAPFAGVVAERTVSVGDYVTKGIKVATVVRITPLRVRLTIPEQFVSVVGVGQPVAFAVDAYPGREFEGTVQYVSPGLEANQRALTVEASVPNPDGALKPGLFATARIEQPQKTPAVLVPAAAVADERGHEPRVRRERRPRRRTHRHDRPDARRARRSDQRAEGRRTRRDEERHARSPTE